jgi:hypothetical protein
LVDSNRDDPQRRSERNLRLAIVAFWTFPVWGFVLFLLVIDHPDGLKRIAFGAVGVIVTGWLAYTAVDRVRYARRTHKRWQPWDPPRSSSVVFADRHPAVSYVVVMVVLGVIAVLAIGVALDLIRGSQTPPDDYVTACQDSGGHMVSGRCILTGSP